MDVRNKNAEDWRGKHYAYFSNEKCEAFPCHSVEDASNFNCLFCYCPLYALGAECGGNFQLRKNGVKDCTGCSVPHDRENYGYITGRFDEIVRKIIDRKP